MFQDVTRGCRRAIGVIAWTAVLMGSGFSLEAEKPKAEGPPLDADVYPLDVCVVTGQKLGTMGEPVIHKHQGREIRFCCKGCIKEFESDPATYLKKIDAAIVKQQMPYYPVGTCVVTGEKLGGAMGKPVDHVHKNRLVRFCCSGCVKAFEKAPLKYTAKLNEAAIEKQAEDYPLETCLVLGTRLGKMGEPISYVSGNRLIKLCCKGCIQTFQKEPAKYLSKLDKAWKAKMPDTHGEQGTHGEHEPDSGQEGHGDGGHDMHGPGMHGGMHGGAGGGHEH